MRIPDTITTSRWDPEAGEHVVSAAPFNWDGTLEEQCEVEALVVDVADGVASYVVTNVIHGRNYATDEFLNAFSTARARFGWFSGFPPDYRSLLSMESRGYEASKDGTAEQYDTIKLDEVELEKGNSIRIEELTAWGESDGRKSGVYVSNVTIVDSDILDPHQEIKRLSMLKQRIVRQLVRGMEKRESITMNSHPRILPNVPFRPFEDIAAEPRVGNRFVFGGAPVDDHFVDVRTVNPYFSDPDAFGTRRFSRDGTSFFTPFIMPFGRGSDEDPLQKLIIHLYSETVTNPAVGEQMAVLTIDDVQYQALANPERSSHYFDNPGHDVVFDGFRKVGITKDAFALSDDQAEAMHSRMKREHTIVKTRVNEAISAGVDITKDHATMMAVEDELDVEIRAKVFVDDDDYKNVKSIEDSEPTSTLNNGAILLVPTSMLDSIEITFLGRD